MASARLKGGRRLIIVIAGFESRPMPTLLEIDMGNFEVLGEMARRDKDISLTVAEKVHFLNYEVGQGFGVGMPQEVFAKVACGKEKYHVLLIVANIQDYEAIKKELGD